MESLGVFSSTDDRLRQLSMALAADGRLHAFGTASDDSIWYDTQTGPGSWSPVVLPLLATFRGEGVVNIVSPLLPFIPKRNEKSFSLESEKSSVRPWLSSLRRLLRRGNPGGTDRTIEMKRSHRGFGTG
jgi:hypothetical protein